MHIEPGLVSDAKLVLSYATGIAVVVIALFGLRAVWEENTLKAELPGYPEYAARVRYRLVPGLW